MGKVLVLILLVIVIVLLVWRFSSRRQSIPCPTWLGWMVERDNPFTKINRSASIIENAAIEKGMVVLDAGCGPGRVTLPLANKVGPTGGVTALDLQQGMLQKTREKAEEQDLKNITYLQAGLGEKKLEQEKFDRVVLVTVLGEIPDQKAALHEIYNALKPGGILSVTETIFDPHFQRRSTVLRLAEEEGFSEKERFGSSLNYTMNLEKSI